MTTVVFRDGILSTDSLVCDGSVRCGTINKAHIINDVGIAAGSGTLIVVQTWVEWLRSGSPPDEWPPKSLDCSNFEGMFVHFDGTVHYYAGGTPYTTTFNGPYHTLGSGQEFARGALEFGASAHEAVEVACRLDVNSMGPVQDFHLETIRASVRDAHRPKPRKRGANKSPRISAAEKNETTATGSRIRTPCRKGFRDFVPVFMQSNTRTVDKVHRLHRRTLRPT